MRSADPALCAIASDTPVIVLTSHPDEIDRVRLLERGGDDVIARPFSYPELRARIAAVLRRTAPRQPELNSRGFRVEGVAEVAHRSPSTTGLRFASLDPVRERRLSALVARRVTRGQIAEAARTAPGAYLG